VGRGGRLRIGMGIIDRVTEGESRMEPGVIGVGAVLPNVLGDLVATGEAVGAVGAAAWDDCPDA
jgi:hypothetical protein